MATTASPEQELTVKGESIETTYRNYLQGKYWVNRRYQRKLIWTLAEKQGFIDSIANGYPVPLILLAENAREQASLEIIDGMQRLNAVVSFISNEYSVRGAYFDLNTMAATKELLDLGFIEQRQPVLDRGMCVKIATYALPFSIYEFNDAAAVDEVFRRINSGGRQLSRQELRTAGSLGHFATAVRKIAAQVRGDESHSDVLRLNEMAKISITNRDLEYGIPVDDIFWVQQNILTKDQVRESRDEELIADIVAYMVLDEPPSSRSEFIDDYYGADDSDASKARYAEVETAVQRRTVELVINDFHRAIDELRLTLTESGQTFGQLLFEQQPARAPRYFQAVLLAFYKLIVRDQLQVAKRGLLISRMTNSAHTIPVPEGGRWGGEDRHATVLAVAGVYAQAFEPAEAGDPSLIHWITRLENLLAQSLTEQSLYDYKQGFLRLDGSSVIDDEAFQKILKTCVAVANHRRGTKGYVIVGVSDNRSTTDRVTELYGVKASSYAGFDVVGVGHEAAAMGKSADEMFQTIIDKISASPISSPLRQFIARSIKPIVYFGKTVYIFESEGQEDVSSYDGVFYDRRGAQLYEVTQEELPQFIRRYVLG